jgi:hypothetical protein
LAQQHDGNGSNHQWKITCAQAVQA